MVNARLDVNCRYSGVVCCAAFRNESQYYGDQINITSVTQVTAAGYSASFAPYQDSVIIIISGLNAVTTYAVYCYVSSTVINEENSLADVVATGTAATTSCCNLITFSNQPSFIYADSSRYSTSSSGGTVDASKFTFTFALTAALKSAALIITPEVTFASNGSSVPRALLTTAPSSITFQKQTTALTSSFVLLVGTTSFNEAIKLSLSLSSSASSVSSSYATPAALAVQILSSTSSVPAPRLSQALFGNSGQDAYVVFDSATDLVGLQLQASWSCDTVFAFLGANATTCTWLNYTSVRAVFPTFSSQSLLEVGGNVTLLGQKIKPYCDTTFTTLTACAKYNYSGEQSTAISSASNPVSPSVIVQIPSSIGSCDNLTINAAASTGFGGRNWRSVEFIVSTVSQTVSTSDIQELLDSYGTNIMQVISIPKAYLLAGQTYSISLTVTNLFGLEGTGVASVTVSDSPYAPKVSIAGSSTITMTAAEALSLSVAASFSSCLSSTVLTSLKLSYAWTLYAGASYRTGTVVSVSSSSVTPSKYTLPAYALTAVSTYTLFVNVSVSSASSTEALASSIATASIVVTSGNVYAVILDGSYRAVASTATITIDARKSYDQDSSTATLLYAWSCSVLSLSSFGSNCSSIFNLDSIEGKVIVYGSAMNASLVYGLATVVSSTDGRSDSQVTSLTRNEDASTPSTQIQLASSPTSIKFNINEDLTLVAYIQCSSSAVQSAWAAYIDNSNISISAASPQSKFLASSLVQSLFSFPFVVGAGSFAPGMTASLQISASTLFSTNSDGRRLASSSGATGYSQMSLIANGPPTGGSAIVSPTTGSALSTVFVVQAIGFVDDDPTGKLFSSLFSSVNQ